MITSLPARLMANSTDKIANISSARVGEFFNYSFGGDTLNATGLPNWGMSLFTVANVYPDYVGNIAWFVLFAIPFLMMWLTHTDLVPAAMVGIFIGLYVVGFIGTQYFGFALALIALSIASIIWSIYLRRL